ncbi:PaaI family thioesterase [Cryptosporangium aurantiacum]|uniref:Acyl-coenzyme A thioesterase THEM4 n=1 Tax=Cryptosporangium aurantiacum TaxID=134849 RepID=A0A1M7R4M4_9ACTN|nr:PaaI family thioesterase [Cryptosporangium aurantiacum]SHN40029.1 Thioesterase superfamily protein [Cryptosporangium aurantiacum]
MSTDENAAEELLRGPEGLGRRDMPTSWTRRPGIEPTPDFLAMIDALRALQDDVTAAVPPPDVLVDTTKTLSELSERLRAYAAPERDQLTGRLITVPGRGQTMSPVLHLDEWSEHHARGHVTFGRFYLGGNGAVHGGAIPLLFDEILGRLANTGGRRPSRTAFLHVNYRSITPIGVELQIEGRFEREEGRKRFLTAELRHGDTLCADAEGLFVQLKPGQP